MSGSYTAYPKQFANEIWDPPKWVYAKGVSLSSGKAAKFLGLHRYTLVQNADSYGLTVIRRGTDKRIFFLVTELNQLKEALQNVTRRDVIRAAKGKGNAVL